MKKLVAKAQKTASKYANLEDSPAKRHQREQSLSVPMQQNAQVGVFCFTYVKASLGSKQKIQKSGFMEEHELNQSGNHSVDPFEAESFAKTLDYSA